MTSAGSSGVLISDGFPLRYIIDGTGIPFLVVGSSLYDERVFSPELRKYLRFVFTDHRGFVPPGQTTPDHSAYDLPVLVNDVEKIRRQLELDKVIICGHSGHAFMALEYAKTYPSNVAGVVLTGCGPSNSDERRQASFDYFEQTASAERKALFGQRMNNLEKMIHDAPEKRFISYCLCSSPQGWYDLLFDPSPLWDGLYTNMQMIDYVWGEVFRDIDIIKGLHTLDKPVFLALGRYDYLTGPPELWDPILPHFADLTTRVFEKSAHCPQYEECELFNTELLTWVEENITLKT